MEVERVYRLRYSAEHIISILDNYSSVADGCFGNGHSAESTRKNSIFKAPFENSIISKADIDTAIDKLGKPGLWNKYCKDIEQLPAGYNLSLPQYIIAEYIQGSNSEIKGLACELARLA